MRAWAYRAVAVVPRRRGGSGDARMGRRSARALPLSGVCGAGVARTARTRRGTGSRASVGDGAGGARTDGAAATLSVGGRAASGCARRHSPPHAASARRPPARPRPPALLRRLTLQVNLYSQTLKSTPICATASSVQSIYRIINYIA